ncbi:MAG: M48 family metalloprotease [Gemmatimonadota bacterium]
MRNYIVGSILLVAACATNPVTGKSQLSLVSESQEIEMGRGELARAKQETGFIADAALEQYVASIGKQMAAASERPNLPWEFHVLDDPMVNAFAAPGGFVFVTRGILTYLNSEAELAAVLGHEIGHVTAKHTVAMISQQQLAQVGLIAGSIAAPDAANGIAGQIAGAATSLYFLKFSRNDESQADQLGHRYSLMQGYDVREMPNTFRTLERLAAVTGSGGTPSFLSTHPDPGSRVQKTQAWADTVSNPSRLHSDRDRFLNRIDGLVFGADPEQGYFEGGYFLHPTLRFRFAVPQGWQTLNQLTQVVMAEPNGQAQVSLTPSQQTSASAAAQAFLAQQGITSAGAQRTTVNGLPAVAADFTATTQQGQALRGTVVFVEYGGSVYQFLGIALASAWSQQGGTISQVLRSFGPTPAGQQFQRRKYLKVVTLSRNTSVATLAQQSDGAVTAQQLAIINGVADGASIPAGRRVKTVVYR